MMGLPGTGDTIVGFTVRKMNFAQPKAQGRPSLGFRF